MRATRPLMRPIGNVVRLRLTPGFASSVLMAMVTALLCALLPAGLPQTTTVGSAFNPATTLVALKAPASARVIEARAEAEEDAHDDSASADSLALGPVVFQLSEPAPVDAATVLLPAASPAVRGPLGAGYARAPPAA